MAGTERSGSGQYSQEDVQQILQLAIARQTEQEEAQEQLTRSQLLEIAEEMGISPVELELAESEWQGRQRQQINQQAFDRDRHQQFQRRAVKFLILNGFLIALNLLTSGGLTWSLYVLVFWGLGLALRARQAYFLSGTEYQRRFERWQRKRVLTRSFSSVLNRLLPS